MLTWRQTLVHGHFRPWTDLDPWPLSTMGIVKKGSAGKTLVALNSDVDFDADIGPWSDIDPWPDNGPRTAVKVEDHWAPIPTLARRRTWSMARRWTMD